MSFSMVIENQLHEGRVHYLHGEIDQAIQCFSQVLSTLENHIPQCDGEEKEWTTSCFNRTLEEFSFITTRRGEQENESNIATETIEVITESDRSFCTIMRNYGNTMKTKWNEFNDKHDIGKDIKDCYQKGKNGVCSFYNNTAKPAFKHGYAATAKWCEDHEVKKKSKSFIKKTGELFVKGMKSCGNLFVKGYSSLMAFLYLNAAKQESKKNKTMAPQHTKSE